MFVADAIDGPFVTVAVVTRNRREELARALESILAQDQNLEVLVIDDASNDGTSEMVPRDFPTVRLRRLERPLGPSGARNVAMSEARGRVVVCLDDDAYFPSPHTIGQVVRQFDDPRIGVVAIPFDDVLGGERITRATSPGRNETWIAPTFIGAAYAVRADVFRHVGGYVPELPMYFEESSLSLRLLDAGYLVRLSHADPALHVPSPVRSLRRMDVQGRRNELVWVWMTFPAPWHLVYIVGYVLKAVIYGIRVRRLRHMLRGVAEGLRAIPVTRREPVSRRAFRIDRRLRRHRHLPLTEVERDASIGSRRRIRRRSSRDLAGPRGEGSVGGGGASDQTRSAGS